LVLGAAQLAKKSQPVAQAVAVGQHREAVGPVGKQRSRDRQQNRRRFFGGRLEIDRLGLHAGCLVCCFSPDGHFHGQPDLLPKTKKMGVAEYSPQNPLNAR